MQHRSMFLPNIRVNRSTTKPHGLPKVAAAPAAPVAPAPAVVLDVPANVVSVRRADLLVQNGVKLELPLTASLCVKSLEFADVRISKPTVASVTSTITNVGEHRILLRSMHRVAVVDAGGVVELNPADASHWKFIAVTPLTVLVRTR